MARSDRPGRAVIVAGAILALVGLAAAAWWLLPGVRPTTSDAGAPAAQETTTAPAPSTFPPQRARDIEAALLAGDEASARSVLAIPPSQPLDPAFTQALVGFEQVAIDDTTFRQDGDTAQVDAQVRSGGADAAWTLYLVQVDGTWLVAATTPR